MLVDRGSVMSSKLPKSTKNSVLRRSFLQQGAGLAALSAGTLGLPGRAFAIGRSAKECPKIPFGLQLGDLNSYGTMVWSKTDRPSQMIVEVSRTPDFRRVRRFRGSLALAQNDYTARMRLRGGLYHRDAHVRVSFQSLSSSRLISEPVVGSFRLPSRSDDAVRFCWGGDTAGQGWGINPDFGGMKIYESMRQIDPDFFIHSGDVVYADGPIPESRMDENNEVWNNLVTPEVIKVAETLKEFRGRYQYNMMDANVRRFNAQVPQIWQWDDHEVVNNWSSAKDLSDDERYTEKNVSLLIRRGAKAFQEYAPMMLNSTPGRSRVYRKIPYGDLLEVFVLDMRSYRGPNTANDQTEQGPETAFLGEEQLSWLKRSLRRSRAVWKVIASDMPVGLVVRDGPTRFENVANGDGPALGRELELVNLFRYLKQHKIENTVWLTADVHYCAAHHYAPERAQFKDFLPFWEFVSGPLNAGSFGPNELDNTFGPRVDFQLAPDAPNLSPRAGLQFFGQVDIDRDSREMTVRLKDLEGAGVYEKTLTPKLR